MTSIAGLPLTSRQTLILGRVFENGYEKDLASLAPNQYLTDAVLNTMGSHIVRNSPGHQPTRHAWIPTYTVTLFKQNRANLPNLPVDFDTSNGQLYTVQHETNHWILHHIDLNDKSMYVYDSLRRRDTQEEIKSHQNHLLAILRRMFPSIISKIGKWTFHSPDTSLPQQDKGFECGDFTLAVLQKLLSGGSIRDIDPLSIADERPRIAEYLMATDVNGRVLKSTLPTNQILELLLRRTIYARAKEDNKDIPWNNSLELPPGSYYVPQHLLSNCSSSDVGSSSGLTQSVKRVQVNEFFDVQTTKKSNMSSESATITLSSSNENTLVDDIVVDEAFNDSNPVAANYRDNCNNPKKSRFEFDDKGRRRQLCITENCKTRVSVKGLTCAQCTKNVIINVFPEGMPVGTISIPQNGKKYIACKSAKNRNGIHWSPICMNLDCTTHVQTPGDMCACISGKSRRVFPKTAEIGDIFRDNNDVLWVPFWYNRLLRWRPKCSTPDCVTMVIKEGSACRWCKCGMKRIIHPKNPYIGMTFIDEDTGVTYRYDPGEQWHALCAVCDNISVFLGYCRGHAHENGIGVFEKNATGVWLMNLISPGGYEVGVYGGFSKLSNPKHAAQQQVTRDGCTTRHLTRQGFKPDIENAFVLHVGSSENRFQRKFYARDKLGAICTFHRPQKQNVLSPQEMDEIDVAIENNLQNIPDITLFGMNKMDFWQNRPKFQGHYRKRRITLTEEEYQKVVKEVEDKLRESAWETMMEQDKDADE